MPTRSGATPGSGRSRAASASDSGRTDASRAAPSGVASPARTSSAIGARAILLARVGARLEDHRAAGADGRGQGAAEPGLADAWLSLDHQHAPGRPDRSIASHERVELSDPTDQRDGRPTGAVGQAAVEVAARRMRRRRRWRSAVLPGADRLGDRCGLGQRSDTELAIEDPDALAVLLEGRAGFADPGERGHQQPMRRLVERIELKPAPGDSDSSRPRADGCPTTREAFQRARQLAPVRLGFGELPLVERLAVAQGEPGHELAPVKGRGLVEERQTARAGSVGRVPVSTDPGQGAPEGGQVDMEVVRAERDRGSIDLETRAAESAIEDRQRPTQGSARLVPA